MTRPLINQSGLTSMSQSAEAGELHLSHAAAQDCATACDAFISGVRTVIDGVINATLANGFGTLPSGLALGEKFGALSSQDLPRVLAQHIEVATRLKSVFEAAGRAYEQTESHTTATILASGD